MHPLLRQGLHRRVKFALLMVLLLLAPLAAAAGPYAALVMDARSGEVLHARNADTRLHPASLTKMMTLYVAFEAIRNGEITLDTPVRISAKAAAEPPSKLGLRPGQTIALRYLIRAAALRSANDAATAIGEAISGSEAAFTERMTRTARAIGMSNTTFRNAHGLTQDGHLSTARDMTILGRQLFFDYPEYWNLFSRRSADAGLAQVNNTNQRFLDNYRGADGIKTGFTRAAGFNLTASAERDGKRIIVTVFGGTSIPDRTAKVTELMNLGFREAPARVAVRRPPTPSYRGNPPRGQTLVLSEAPNATAAGERPAAGRTIRLNTAVTRSPIPQLRPRAGQAEPAETVIAALQEGIDAALAEAVVPFEIAEAAAAAAPAAPAAPEPRPEELPFAVAEAEAEASADAAEPVVPQPRPEELPFAIAEAEAEALEIPVPQPRPEELPFELVADDDTGAEAPLPYAIAEAADDTAEPALQTIAEAAAGEPALADAVLAADMAELVEPAAAAAIAPAFADGEALEAEFVQVAAAVAPVAERARVAAPPPRPDPLAESMIVLTYSPRDDAAGSGNEPLSGLVEAAWAEPAPAVAEAAEPIGEVIERTVSTSQPRLWAISLGRFGSRDAAERAMIRTALSELSSLDGSVRRVQQGSGSFEATFVGLSEQQAHLACDRLRARERECAILAP